MARVAGSSSGPVYPGSPGSARAFDGPAAALILGISSSPGQAAATDAPMSSGT